MRASLTGPLERNLLRARFFPTRVLDCLLQRLFCRCRLANEGHFHLDDRVTPILDAYFKSQGTMTRLVRSLRTARGLTELPA